MPFKRPKDLPDERWKPIRHWSMPASVPGRVEPSRLRLEPWHRPGLLCIGDAAHAMSPIGGIGINLAIQDAVAAANILVPWLGAHAGPVGSEPLARIERRRRLPTRLTQRLQVLIQNRVISRVLEAQGPLALPLRLLKRFPALRRFPARLIGMGLRPEHARSAARDG